MFRIVIAEDEDFIRDGIKSLIKEALPDSEIIGDFADGEMVIETVKKQHVDLIITDIRMPKVSGIDIAKYVYEHKLNIPILMITAYRNFEYAKDALNYNVKNLITKPIDFDEFVSSINSILKEKNSISALEDAYRVSNNLIKKRNDMRTAFYRYTSGSIDFEALSNEYPEEMAKYRKNFCYLIDFRLEARMSVETPEWENFCDISNNRFEAFCLRAGKNSADILLIVFAENHEEILKEYVFEVKKFIKSNYKSDIKYNSRGYQNFLLIPIENMRGFVSLYTGYLLSKNVLCDDLLEKLYENSTDLWFINFLYAVINNLKENVEMDTDRFLTSARFAENKDEIKKVFYDIQKAVSSGSDSKILSVKAYISDHYNENLSLESVAEAFNLNPSYFSRMFKKETGEKFADYLIRFKIKKAKELLADGTYSLDEICEKIGYNSVSYFSKVFKAYTGMTLKQYRDSFGD